MSKQCTKPKRKRDDSAFKDKVLLVQAQANGQILHEEELAFLADPGISEGQATQTVITHNALIKPMIWMHMTLIVMNSTLPKLVSWRIYLIMVDVLVEVHNPNNMGNNMIIQGVQAMPSSEQSSVVNHSETEITSDSNIIPYSQYMHETQQAANTTAIVIPNSEETLMLAEENRSKMLLKQQYPMVLEKKVNTKPVDYDALNKLSQDFEK
ncbi:hypothetical protein Tco_1221724 [Tanacetum coccineum]